MNRSAMDKPAACRDRVDDQVVRGRDQQRDDRGGDHDVDGIIGAIAAPAHLRDHQPANGRGVGHGRAGNAAEHDRGNDADLAQAAAQMSDKCGGEIDKSRRDAAANHEVTGIDEERDRHQNEDGDARCHALEHHQRRQAEIKDRQERGDAEAKGDRRSDDKKCGERAKEQPVFHRAEPMRKEKPSSGLCRRLPCRGSAPTGA